MTEDIYTTITHIVIYHLNQYQHQFHLIYHHLDKTNSDANFTMLNIDKKYITNGVLRFIAEGVFLCRIYDSMNIVLKKGFVFLYTELLSFLITSDIYETVRHFIPGDSLVDSVYYTIQCKLIITNINIPT